MTKSLLAALIFLAAPLAAAQEEAPAEPRVEPPPAQQSSTGQGIKADATRAKEGIKSTAREVKEGVKSGARKVRRGLAVAQCNDGRYSYTHHLTCNHHGGIRKRFR